MKKWLLPFKWETRFRWYVIATCYFITTYMVSNHYPLFPPQFLPLTALDRSFPLWPPAGWIYATVYAMPVAVPFFIYNRYSLNVTLISFFLIASIEAFIFLSYPTIYPRHLYPLPDGGMGFQNFPLNYIRMIDQPTNCFPSQHVSLAFLTAFVVERANPKAGIVAVLWAVAIAFSTLWTKQHYIWDLVFGYAITRIVFLTVLRIIPQEADE